MIRLYLMVLSDVSNSGRLRNSLNFDAKFVIICLFAYSFVADTIVSHVMGVLLSLDPPDN